MNKNDIIGQNARMEFLERIARMYYLFDMTQKDISTQMGIGRSSVARFIKEAKDENVVRFLINANTGNARRVDLESKLVKKYKLIDAIVVKEDIDSLYESTVVNYLNTTIPFKGTLGLGGGTTLQGVGKFLNVCDARPDLNIVQMIGGLSTDEREMSYTSEIKDIFLKNKNIKDVYEEIRKIDVSIVGIGNVDEDSVILNYNIIEDLSIDYLQNNSVGDINFHYFDINGDFTLPDISERVIGA